MKIIQKSLKSCNIVKLKWNKETSCVIGIQNSSHNREHDEKRKCLVPFCDPQPQLSILIRVDYVAHIIIIKITMSLLFPTSKLLDKLSEPLNILVIIGQYLEE